jgi:hypothetical protein
MYAVTFAGVAATASVDVFEYVAPSTRVVIIHGAEIGQITDMGDAASEALGVLHKRGATTSGSGGTTFTPLPLEPMGPAASGVAEFMNTTKSTAGTITNLHSAAWNIQQPYIWLPTPEMRHVLAPSQRYAIEISAPADSITMYGTLIVEELG